MSIVLKRFTDYAIPADWRFVPIRKGTKAPIGNGWQNNPFTWDACPKPGDFFQGQSVGAVGILFGHGGVVGLDFDGASVDQMLAEWGVSLPDTTVISSGRPGHCLKLFKIPEAYWDRVQSTKFKTGTVVQEYGKEVHEQLELRWRGSQSLVYGSHPETGNQYRVLNWIEPLPELPAELLYRMLKPEERNHRPPEGHNKTDQDWAREYLEFIDPNPLDWYTWRDVLFGCHAAGLSEAEVRAWSTKSAKHTDRGFDQVWRYIKGRPGIGLGTLGWLAKQGGWEPKAKNSKKETPDVTSEQVNRVLAEYNSRFDIYQLIPTELAKAITLKAKTFELPPETLLTVFFTVASSLVPHKLSLGDEYTTPGILWLGLVGESGTGKTPVINTFTKPLSKFQSEAYERYELALEDYRKALEDKEKKEKPSPPNRRFYYLQDFTWESISTALKARNHCLIYSDELAGFVLGQNQYKAKGGNDRQRWLTAYDGGAIDVLRTSKNLHIPDVSLSVLGGIQPSILQHLISADGETVDGFWARFIWVELPSRKVPCPIDAPTVNLSELLAGIYERLDQRAGVINTFRLCSQGKRLWVQWWDEIESLKDAEVNPFLRAIYPKALERAGRIALVAHCVASAFRNDYPSEVIPHQTLEAAIAFVRWLLQQARMVYADCGHCENPEVQRIARFVQRFAGKQVTGDTVRNWWSGRKKPSRPECRRWLANLVALGYGAIEKGTPDQPDFLVRILRPTSKNPKNTTTSTFQADVGEVQNVVRLVQRPEGEDASGLSGLQNGLRRSPPETSTASQVQPIWTNGLKIDDSNSDVPAEATNTEPEPTTGSQTETDCKHDPSRCPGEGWFWLSDPNLPGGGEWVPEREFEKGRLSDEEVRTLAQYLILSVDEGPEEVRENWRQFEQMPQHQKDQIWAAIPQEIQRQIREILSSPPVAVPDADGQHSDSLRGDAITPVNPPSVDTNADHGDTVEQEPGQSQLIDRHNPDKPPPGDGWYWFPDDSLPNGGEWAHISECEKVIWYDQEGES